MIGKNKRAELSLALKGRLMRGLGNPFANLREGLDAGKGAFKSEIKENSRDTRRCKGETRVLPYICRSNV